MAAIITTLELLVSVILSYMVFKEAIVGWKLVGILMVVFSVIIVQTDKLLPVKNKNTADTVRDFEIIPEERINNK